MDCLFVFRRDEGTDGCSEDIEVWDNHMRKRDVDECRQEDGQIRSNKIDDKHLLDKGDIVLFFGFVVFKDCKSLC